MAAVSLDSLKTKLKDKTLFLITLGKSKYFPNKTWVKEILSDMNNYK